MNLKQFFKNKKILVTGGTGMIGRALISKLKNFDCRIVSVSLDRFRLKKNKKIKYIYGNLENFEFCKKITKRVDFVFHIAGIKGSAKITLEKPSSFFVPLLMMNTNLLEASRINNIKRLVFTSSIGAYEIKKSLSENGFSFNSDPMDYYPGWAKRMAEMQIKTYKKQYNLKHYYIARPSNVYGPYDNFNSENSMVIPSLIKKVVNCKKNQTIKVHGTGEPIRDFVYCDDVAEGLINLIFFGSGKLDFLNLGGKKKYKIKKILEILLKLKNFKYKFSGKKDFGYLERILDIKNAKKKIKYNPKVSLENGLKKTYEWYSKNQSAFKYKKNYLN